MDKREPKSVVSRCSRLRTRSSLGGLRNPTMGRRSCLLVMFSRSQVCSPDSYASFRACVIDSTLLHSLCVGLSRIAKLLGLAVGSWLLLIFGGLLLARKVLVYVLAPTCKRQASSESVELARMPFAVKKKSYWFARRGLATSAKREILLSVRAVREC